MTDGALRMRVFAFIALVLFGGLVARLWYLQGLEAQREELQQRAQTNVLEEVYEEARGPHPRPQRPGHRRQQGR